MIALMQHGSYVTVKDRFKAEKFAMTLGERDSSATITIGPDAPEIIIGDVLKDETEPGAGIVWRVSKVDTDYNTNTRTLTCNHVISLLKEKIMFGEQTTATICKRKGATTCTAKEAMRYVMSFQRDFELNDFPKAYENVSNAYSFNGDDLFSAMETISDTLEDCWWEYDLRTYPFKLNLRDRSQAGVETELRLSRNIQNAKITVDLSNTFTRLFPIGKNDLQLSEKYISRNENLYGMRCKTMTEGTKETEAALREWANTQLKYGAEPAVTVTISAADLSQQTGEPLDHIMLGSICQMPLPAYNTTIKERINKMAWSDKIKDPNSVTVTLANTRKTVSTIVSSAIKSSSKSGRVSSTNTSKGVLNVDITQDKKDANKYILWKQDYKGVWKDVATFSRAVASWTVSATGGTIKVTAHPQEQSKDVKVRAATGGSWKNNIFTGQIQYSADNGSKWYSTGAVYTVDATIRYNAGWIAAARKVVLPEEEVTNNNAILVKAPSITVGGTVTKSYIMWSYDNNHVDLQTLVGDEYVTVARYTHGKYNAGWSAAYNKVSLPKTEVTNINSIVIHTPPRTVDGAYETTSYIMSSYDNNHVDLQTLVNEEYVTVARLTHGKYTAGWRAAYGKVDLPKTEVTNINSIVIHTPPYTVDGEYETTSYIMWSYDNNHVDLQTLVNGDYVTVARLTHGKYSAGWAAAYGKVDLPKTEVTNINSIVIHTPPSTVDGAYETTSYIMSSYDNNHVDLQTLVNGNYVTVARLTHSKYNAGWTAAYNKVSLAKTEVTNINSIVIHTPPSTVDGEYETTTYILETNGNNNVDLKTWTHNEYITVARLTHGKYNAGWTAAYNKVSLAKTEVTNINSIVIHTPPSTVDGEYETTTYILETNGNNNVDLKTWTQGTYITVARLTHGKYDAGWAAARNEVSIPTAEGTASSFYIDVPSSTVGYSVQHSYKLYPAVNYTHLQHWDSASSAWVTVARAENYFNMSGTLYYDSMEPTSTGFKYHYHQTVSQTTQAIVTSGSKTVRWRG